MSPLEFAICQQLLPMPIPHPLNNLEYELCSLPVSVGGLGICDHVILQLISHDLFCPLVDLILYQHDCLPHDVIDSQCLIFKQLSQARYVLGLS